MISSAVQSDIVVHRADGRLVAAIDVKNRQELNGDIASVLRRNLITHGLLSDVPFFLLVSQDRGFLWANVSVAALSAPPTLEFAMLPVLRRYLPPAQLNGRRMRAAELELLVFIWLSDLSQDGLIRRDDPERSLGMVGFLDAMHQAEISRGTQK